MRDEDLSSVCEIENLSFPNPWHKKTFMGEIRNYPISFPFVIVCKPESKIVGYIVFWFLGEEVQINNLAIHPDFRRRGIAKTVLQQILCRIQKEGAKSVILEVRPSNSAARSLYARLGFEALRIRKDYYHSPQEDALVMGKQLIQ